MNSHKTMKKKAIGEISNLIFNMLENRITSIMKTDQLGIQERLYLITYINGVQQMIFLVFN